MGNNQPRIKVDINHMMAEYLGAGQGFTPSDISGMVAKLQSAKKAVESKRGQGMLGWMELPYNQEQVVEKIERVAKHVAENFDNFVVLGIGGSALGPTAVQAALNHMRYNDLSRERRGGPKLYVEDNIDPERMSSLLDVIDVTKTCFNVISKSGSTSETMAQYLIITDLLRRKVGEGWQKHIIATTDERGGNLVPLAQKEGYETFVIPDGVGGRFSELCPVGLLPAAVCGIDIRGLLAGAAEMDTWCRNEEDVRKNPALLTAGLMMQGYDNGKNISVMMPYADSLRFIADWYVQLWGESLGKKSNRAGETVHVGQTPMKAVGVTDQHSQVQLFVEGPFDKIVTFIGVEQYRTMMMIPDGCEGMPNVSFLSGHTLNELIKAEQAATEYALGVAGKMNMTITLPSVTPHALGQLLYFFMLQTAYSGELLGIDAFDQPGVEGGKNATYALLGRPGFEQKKAELEGRAQRREEYVL